MIVPSAFVRRFVYSLGLLIVATGLAVAAEPAAAQAGEVPILQPPTPPTKAVKMAPGLIDQHPRLYFNAKELEALRIKLKSPEMNDIRSAYLLRVDEIAKQVPPTNPPNTEDPFRGFGDRLPKLAFAWLISGDTTYLNAAKAWINAIIDYPSWAGDVDLGASHICYGMAVAYDWLYQDLAPEERAKIEKSLTRHGQILLNKGLKNPGNWWGWAYFQNHCWINYTAVSTIGMVMYEKDPQRFQLWIDQARTIFDVPYRHMGVDGGFHEGVGYMRYGTEWLLYYVEALRDFSGEDLSDMQYLQKVDRFIIDTFMPDRRNVVHFADCPAEAWGATVPDAIMAWLVAKKKNRVLEWIRLENRRACSKIAYDSPFALIWADVKVKPQAPDDLPTLGVYPDLGIVVSRTSWNEDAAVMAFKCGPPGGHYIYENWKSFPLAPDNSMFGHSHPDANTFFYWSKGQWRISQPAQYMHDKTTHYANTWQVGGMGQRGDAEWMNTSSYVNAGKQPYLVRVASTKECDYVIGEAAPAYVYSAKLDSFRRHLLFVKKGNPYIVIYDRLSAKQPEEWASYWHSFGSFEALSSTEFKAAGAFPVFSGQKPYTPANVLLTPTYGQMLSPVKLTLEPKPLNIVGHPMKKPLQQGFELVARQPSNSMTWLVTVISDEKPTASFVAAGEYPNIKVNGDTISWDGEGDVTFNGKEIKGNLLKR